MTTALKKARTKRAETTPIAKGWVVTKRYQVHEKDPKREGEKVLVTKTKVISKRFSSHKAAEDFGALARKYPPTIASEELNVEFYVTTDDGHDDLPENF